jgi:hypothetical protein
MKPDKFKRAHRIPAGTERLRRQIACEAARRLLVPLAPADDQRARLEALTETELYTAKRKAAAVLGHRIRPGDLPSDSEVRSALAALINVGENANSSAHSSPEPEEHEEIASLADHLDRFAIYKLRLDPLERVKQDPRSHPEGDALYHSLQVFELAREARPYDEEFLLAALLHDVGKAIDLQDRVAAAVESLRGAVPERTLWLIAHQKDARGYSERTLGPRDRSTLEASELFADLVLLVELDAKGRVPGTPVGTVDQALDYLRGLEREEYLEK